MESPWQNSGYLLSAHYDVYAAVCGTARLLWPIKEKSLVINPNLVQNPGWL